MSRKRGGDWERKGGWRWQHLSLQIQLSRRKTTSALNHNPQPSLLFAHLLGSPIDGHQLQLNSYDALSDRKAILHAVTP